MNLWPTFPHEIGQNGDNERNIDVCISGEKDKQTRFDYFSTLFL